MWCTISWPQFLGSPDCTERLQVGPRGPSQIAEVEISSIAATKISALRDSEGSGSTKASGEEKASSKSEA